MNAKADTTADFTLTAIFFSFRLLISFSLELVDPNLYVWRKICLFLALSLR
ncbi:hypothetical protein ACS0TY_017482 [Phlomoides rotata]